MSDRPRTYRKKPFAVLEHGTRIYSPTRREPRLAGRGRGRRGHPGVPQGGPDEEPRARARVIEADLARRAPLRPAAGTRTVTALAEAYLAAIEGRSFRYQERQSAILSRCWVLPHLGRLEVDAWTPADSERLLNLARRRLAPASVQGVGSVLRSLVTHAHKARWLRPEADPMWHVGYSARPTHQGQAVGFVVRSELPNDVQCAALFAALAERGEPTWALAMRLAQRSGVRWGELVALRPIDVAFEPHRSVYVRRPWSSPG